MAEESSGPTCDDQSHDDKTENLVRGVEVRALQGMVSFDQEFVESELFTIDSLLLIAIPLAIPRMTATAAID